MLAAHKVRIGVQSYSFRTLPIEDALKAMKEIGLAECELWSGHLEPRPTMVAGPDGRQRPPEGWRDELRDVAPDRADGPLQGHQGRRSRQPA